MKWAIIGIIGLVVLGGVGFAVYRWTDLPERTEEWMNEQDLKNFPTLAKREVKEMRENLAGYEKSKKELQTDIIKREGRDTWSAQDNEGTILGFTAQMGELDDAIKAIVTQVKDQQAQLVAAGTVDSATGKVPESHEYVITNKSGKEFKWTLAKAREMTDKYAEDRAKVERKRERQQRIVDAKKAYVTKLDDAVSRLAKKIEEMEEYIEDMETEMELLKIEEDIASINASLSGENDDNRFGAAIRKFRDKKKEFLAEQELATTSAPKDDDFLGSSDDTPKGSSASYWE